MISRKQAYYTLYFLIDVIWQSKSEEAREFDESLADFSNFASDMDPFLKLDRHSADPATEYDFANEWAKVTSSETATEEDAYKACMAFIDFYRTQFEFDLHEIVDYMKKLDWKAACAKFCAKYPNDDIDFPEDNIFISKQQELFKDEK